jgi:hypothetical protein
VGYYDLVFEMRTSVMLDIIKRHLKIDGRSLNPPSEWQPNLPYTFGRRRYPTEVSFIIDDLDLSLEGADDTITLRMRFRDSSFAVYMDRIAKWISPLFGIITVRPSIGLYGINGYNDKSKTVVIDFTNSKVSVQFDEKSRKIIERRIEEEKIEGVTVASATDKLRYMLEEHFRELERVKFDKVFRLKTVFPQEGKIGKIDDRESPPVQLRRAELHTIYNFIREKQGLALYGMFFEKRHRKLYQKRREISIKRNHNTVLHIAPKVFHRLMFCPTLAEEFGFGREEVSRLPTSCGSRRELRIANSSYIKSLEDNFQNGYIAINGSGASSEEDCYDAEFDFSSAIRLSIDRRSRIVVNVDPIDYYNINAELEDWCWLFGSIMEIFGTDIDELMRSVLRFLSRGRTSGLENLPINGLFLNRQQRNVSGAMSKVRITSIGMSFDGNISVVPPIPNTQNMHLESTVLTYYSETVESGNITIDDLNSPTLSAATRDCLSLYWRGEMVHVGNTQPDAWPYAHTIHAQLASFSIRSYLHGKPFKIKWWIIRPGELRRATIRPNPGRETQTRIKITTNVHYEFPLFFGTSLRKEVTIGVTLSNDGMAIELRNKPTDGNYQFVLGADVTDNSGEETTLSAVVTFKGDEAKAHELEDFVAYCMHMRSIRRIESSDNRDDISDSFSVIPRSDQRSQIRKYFLELYKKDRMNAHTKKLGTSDSA